MSAVAQKWYEVEERRECVRVEYEVGKKREFVYIPTSDAYHDIDTDWSHCQSEEKSVKNAFCRKTGLPESAFYGWDDHTFYDQHGNAWR